MDHGGWPHGRFAIRSRECHGGYRGHIFPDSRGLLRELGIVPTRNVQFQLADGSIVQDQVGEVRIRINGRETFSTALFGEDGSPVLMGSYELEGVALAVDPYNERLVDLLVSR